MEYKTTNRTSHVTACSQVSMRPKTPTSLYSEDVTGWRIFKNVVRTAFPVISVCMMVLIHIMPYIRRKRILFTILYRIIEPFTSLFVLACMHLYPCRRISVQSGIGEVKTVTSVFHEIACRSTRLER
jgi:hypothetical protein